MTRGLKRTDEEKAEAARRKELLRQKTEEQRWLRERKDARKEEERQEILTRLRTGQQVEVSPRGPTGAELETSRQRKIPVIFMVEQKILSPPLVVESIELSPCCGLMIGLQDDEGRCYEISCYKPAGGPGHMKKIMP
jgi:hypothetical protein